MANDKNNLQTSENDDLLAGGIPGLDLGSVDEKGETPDQDTETVMVFDGKDYVAQVVPRAKAVVITENMMKESWEQAGSDRMDTSKYSPMMKRCFVNKERSDPATVGAHERSYVPCRDKAAAIASGHQYGKVEGWEGEVVHIGDAVLMHVPMPISEAREARRLHEREVYRQTAISEATNSIEAIIDPYRKSGDDQTRVYGGYDAKIQAVSSGDNNDRAMEGAVALQAALERDRSYGKSASFAGFGGSPKFNKGVPESPFFRAAVERATGGN